MAVYDKVLELIKIEIETDPTNRGYAGKTDDEIVALLNTPYDEPVTTYISHPSPLNRVLSGLSGVGNLISKEEVSQSKLIVVKDVIMEVL